MEKKQIKIDSIKTIKVNTRFGEKDKHIVSVGGKDASSFVGSWNKDWKSGDIVEAVVVKNEKDGKTYINLECPPELKKSFGGGLSAEDRAILTRIEGKVDQIITALLDNDEVVAEDDAPFPDEEPAPTEEYGL